MVVGGTFGQARRLDLVKMPSRSENVDTQYLKIGGFPENQSRQTTALETTIATRWKRLTAGQSSQGFLRMIGSHADPSELAKQHPLAASTVVNICFARFAPAHKRRNIESIALKGDGVAPLMSRL